MSIDRSIDALACHGLSHHVVKLSGSHHSEMLAIISNVSSTGTGSAYLVLSQLADAESEGTISIIISQSRFSQRYLVNLAIRCLSPELERFGFHPLRTPETFSHVVI